ncbi:hypothetical protein HZA39_01925 [Candidatus Peregrinibacteria bacterium]|nr:hypothetical protein [Candidatus Peregrinibacteria bacterium]
MKTQLDYYIAACETEDMKTFSNTMKKLEKEYGIYPHFSLKDAESLFNNCWRIFKQNNNPIKQYNALRLVKYVTTSDEFMKTNNNYQKIWEFFKNTIFHENGNVRNAGIHLLSRLYFEMTILSESSLLRKKIPENEIEDCQKFVVDMFLYLEKLERDYTAANINIISKGDLEDESGRPWGGDTKNKQLRTIRRAIEEMDRGTWLRKLLVKYEIIDKEKTEEELKWDEFLNVMLKPILPDKEKSENI